VEPNHLLRAEDSRLLSLARLVSVPIPQAGGNGRSMACPVEHNHSDRLLAALGVNLPQRIEQTDSRNYG
jgi:hypothetical protein